MSEVFGGPNFVKTKTIMSNNISNASSIIDLNTGGTNQNTNSSVPNYTINPELISYISKVHNEQETIKRFNNQIDIPEKKIINQYTGLNENIHFETDKKSKARRSLLYILNNISGGTFCPEINFYFNELREMKKNEKINAEQQKKAESKNPAGTLKESLGFKNPVTRMKTIKNQILSNNTMMNNNFSYNFKKREAPEEEEKRLKKDNYRLKEFKKDYKAKDLENVYSIEEIETGTRRFQLSKEAQAKMELIKEEEKLRGTSKKKKKKRYRKRHHSIDKKKPTVGHTSLIVRSNEKEVEPTHSPQKNTSKVLKPGKDQLKNVDVIQEIEGSES